jgi:hypothetical protein
VVGWNKTHQKHSNRKWPLKQAYPWKGRMIAVCFEYRRQLLHTPLVRDEFSAHCSSGQCVARLVKIDADARQVRIFIIQLQLAHATIVSSDLIICASHPQSVVCVYVCMGAPFAAQIYGPSRRSGGQ